MARYALQSINGNIRAVAIPGGLSAPTINSTPSTNGTEDVAYAYSPSAIDGEINETLRWDLLSGPTGMTINASTGVISWTPTSGQVGDNDVSIRVVDSGSLQDSQDWTVGVSAAESPVEITSSPVTTGTEDDPYSYDVEATGGALPRVYSLDTNPTGMTINSSTGVVSWTPTSGQVGASNNVVVRVTDDDADYDTQSYSITVGAAPDGSSYITESFEGGGSSGWGSEFVEYGIGPSHITTTEVAPPSGSYSYRQKATEDGGLVLNFSSVAGMPGVIAEGVAIGISYYMYYHSSFNFGTSIFYKHLIMQGDGSPPQRFYVDHIYSTPSLGCMFQELASGWLYSGVAATKGSWVHFEFYILVSANAGTGKLKCWVNDALSINLTRQTKTSGSAGYNLIYFDDTATGVPSGSNQFRYWDLIQVEPGADMLARH